MSRSRRGAHSGVQAHAGLELLWPGKYDEAGVRVPVPRRRPLLRTDFEVAPAAPLPTDAQADRLIVADNLLALDALAHRQPGSADLILAYTLLAPHGSLYVHVDPTVGHAIKLLLDEIFGPGCLQREIVWRIGWVSGFKSKARNWIRNHDLIFFYVKDPKRFTFNKLYVPYPPGYTRRDGAPPTGKGVPLDDVWNGNDVEHTLRGPESMDSIQIKSFSREKRATPRRKMRACCTASWRRRATRATWSSTRLRPDATPGLLGRYEGVAMRLARTLTGGEIALREARRVAGGPVQVLAWSWRLPVPVGPAAQVLDVRADSEDAVHTGVPDAFGGSAVALRIERDVLGPQVQPRQGLSPLCCPRVRLGWVREGELRVELVELVEGWPGARSKAADGVIAPGVEFVDGWAVDATGLGAQGGVARFGFVSFRDHHRRTLTGHVDVRWPPTPTSVAARLSIRVRTWDALQRTADVVVTLGTGAGPVSVEAVELQVGTVEPAAGTGTGTGDDEAIA